jgi:hypothetical protein
MAEITPEAIKVRQVTHWQPTFTYTAPGESGTYTFQLILDEGADEFVLTISDGEDADNLFDWLEKSEVVHFDMDRKVLMFGARPTGS